MCRLFLDKTAELGLRMWVSNGCHWAAGRLCIVHIAAYGNNEHSCRVAGEDAKKKRMKVPDFNDFLNCGMILVRVVCV